MPHISNFITALKEDFYQLDSTKKKVVVALVVVTGVALAVSLIALTVFIPPVGAAIGSSLAALTIKVLFGTGSLTLLTGASTFLYLKNSKKMTPEFVADKIETATPIQGVLKPSEPAPENIEEDAPIFSALPIETINWQPNERPPHCHEIGKFRKSAQPHPKEIEPIQKGHSDDGVIVSVNEEEAIKLLKEEKNEKVNIIEEIRREHPHLLGSIVGIEHSSFKGPYPIHTHLNYNDFQDAQEIGFDEGKIVAKEAIKDKGYDPRLDFIDILRKNFRPELVNHVEEIIKPHALMSFTLGHYKMGMIALVAGVTSDDLRALFDAVHGKNHFSKNLLSPSDQEKILSFQSFEEVDDQTLKQMLNSFYKLLNFELKTSAFPSDDPDFIAHLDIVAGYIGLNEFNRRREELSRAEYLAKILAYLELKPGMLVKIPRGRSEYDLYEVKEVMDHTQDFDEKQAVICMVLAPFKKEASDAIVLLRGTQTGKQVGAINSLVRDADSQGVGKTSFQACAPIISDKIKKVAQTLKGPVKLEFQGHSLAGVDAQRILNLIISMMSEGELSQVKHLYHFSHNPPGVELAEARLFGQSLDKLAKDVKIEMNYIFFSGDPISDFGSIYVGADNQDERVSGTIYEVHSVERLLGAHTCVSTLNKWEEIAVGNPPVANKLSFNVYPFRSNQGKAKLLKKYDLGQLIQQNPLTTAFYMNKIALLYVFRKAVTTFAHYPTFQALRFITKISLNERKLKLLKSSEGELK